MKLSGFRFVRLLCSVFAAVTGLTVAHAQTSLPRAQVGVAYSYQITTSPAAPAGTTYSVTGLPPGIAVNTTSGLISGTPSEAQTATGTIRLDYPTGLSDQLSYTLVVDAAAGTPVITSAATATGTVGQAFTTYAVTANPVAASFNIGTLPAGLQVGGTATAPTIVGTPSVAGTYAVVLSANNASGTGAAKVLTITIAPAGAVPQITSATTASVGQNAAFSYTITASNSPTSFLASGLPYGLSLDMVSGVISGTVATPGVYPITVAAANANGTGPSVQLTLSVGDVPSITSSLTANGTSGSSFSYTLTASNNPTSFNVGALPPGLVVNTTTGAISGTPTTVGITDVTVSANNALGTGPTATLVITVSSVPPVIIAAPVITAHPMSKSVNLGASVTLSVTATGATQYQWRRNGTVIAGASGPTYTIESATPADAGSYTVIVTNGWAFVTSNPAMLTVNSVTVPTISTHPTSQSIGVVGAGTLSVSASGAGLTYQWYKDGIAIEGATNATLSLTGVTMSSAGNYSVVVTNGAGSSTSNAAAVSVRGISVFGTLGGSSGSFAMFVRPDLTGVFLAYVPGTKTALISRDFTVDASGHFRATVPIMPAFGRTQPATVLADQQAGYVVDGTLGTNGTVSGTVSGLDMAFASSPAGDANTSSLAGFYQAGAPSSSATSYVILGHTGEAYVLTTTSGDATAGKGTLTPGGAVEVVSDGGLRLTGSASNASVTLTATPTSGSPVTYLGASNDLRADDEKLMNVSSRSGASNGENTMIAGFVIKGTQPKTVLIRAAGPGLAKLDVPGNLAAVRLEIYKGQTLLKSVDDWGASNAATIAAVAERVGAFPFDANSHDSAALMTLEPGAYTAMVTGRNGASGVALVEVYDATEGDIPRAQRLINVSTRARAGAGANSLIGGFVVRGTVPKRVLIRGAGPSLSQLGLTGYLPEVQLTVYSGSTAIAQNSGWTSSPDAAEIALAAKQAYAFDFLPEGKDAAVILNLQPGAYTAIISGANGATGVALVEVYELP